MHIGNLGGNSVCRIKIYIGIPTQEMRSIQASLADLLQNVFQLPYCRIISGAEAQFFRQSDGVTAYRSIGNSPQASETHRDEDPYERVISGATCYTSVFGHWMGGRPGARRVDDHSEIIELIVDEEMIGAAFFLLMTEFVLPALCRSGEDSLLFVVDCYGTTTNRISRFEICRRYKLNGPILRVSNSSAAAKPWQIFPMMLLDAGLFALSRTVDSEKLMATVFMSGDAGHDELLFFSNKWFDWNRDLAKRTRAGQLWRAAISTQADDLHGDSPDSNGDYLLALPVVEIRLMVNHASWWLFSNCDWLFPERQPQTNPPEFVLRLCKSLLNRLREYWIGFDKSGLETAENNYFRVTGACRSSRDPMANAVMWLAFVYDQIKLYSLSNDLFKPEVIDVYDPAPETALADSESEFEVLRDVVLPFEGQSKQDKLSIQKPKECLEYLRSINDQYFPDRCYLMAWGYWFKFKDKLAEVRRGWDERLENAKKGVFSPLEAMDFDWWVSFERDWRSSDPLSRQWISPIVVETAFYWILGNLLPMRCLDALISTPINERKLLHEAIENIFNPREFCGIGDTEAQHDSQGILLLRLVSQAVVSIPVRMARRPRWWSSFDEYNRRLQEIDHNPSFAKNERDQRTQYEQEVLRSKLPDLFDDPRLTWVQRYIRPDILVRAIQHS